MVNLHISTANDGSRVPGGIMKLRFLAGALLGFGLVACGSNQSPTVEAISNFEATTLVEQNPLDLIPSNAHPSKIIGPNTLLPVKVDGSNVDSNLRAYLNAFGIISLGGKGVCSGTHIGNGLVLSAGHCFFGEEPGNLSAKNKECSTTKVYWGYRGSPKTGNAKPAVSLVSQCKKLIYAERSADRDFAIFQVDQAPNVAVPLATGTSKTPAGTKLTIFGYPQGRPLEWSQYCPLSRTTVQGLNMTSMFTYACDTEPGNSGSTVLGVTSSGGVKVVGIHDGAAPTGMDFNYATSISDIRQTLQKKGLNLDQAIVN